MDKPEEIAARFAIKHNLPWGDNDERMIDFAHCIEFAFAAGREAMRERASDACETIARKNQREEGTYPAGKKAGAFECAAAIRALPGKEE